IVRAYPSGCVTNDPSICHGGNTAPIPLRSAPTCHTHAACSVAPWLGKQRPFRIQLLSAPFAPSVLRQLRKFRSLHYCALTSATERTAGPDLLHPLSVVPQ